MWESIFFRSLVSFETLNRKLKVLWNNAARTDKFQDSKHFSPNHSKIDSDFICMLILLVSTTCENVTSFGALLDNALFLFLDPNLEKNRNFQ